MDAHFAWQVTAEQHGQPLLNCLAGCIPYLTAAQWLSLLNQGLIRVNAAVCTDNVRVNSGSRIDYTVPDYHEGEVDINWQCLWSNSEIAAIHKPANLPVNRTTRNVYNTLIQLLRRESPWPDAHLLHRLDTETSGIILIGQNHTAALRHQAHLDKLIQRKIYHAIVHGNPGWSDMPFACDLNTLPDSAIRSQMHVVPDGQGKSSRSHFRLLKQLQGFALLECEIFTGRKHQIRAQLASLGHPIIGDKIYAHQGRYYLKRLQQALDAQDYAVLLSEQHLLHAQALHLHNLWQAGGPPIVIEDLHYPDHWQAFIARH